MKIKFVLITLACLGLLFGSGCQAIRPQDYAKMPPKKDHVAYKEAQAKMDGTWHGIWIPANTNIVIPPWRKFDPVWEIFGNADDPKPPTNYHASLSVPLRQIMWWFRNPCHNLFFYGIGVADKDKVRFGKYPELITKPDGSWTYAETACGHVRLPCISTHVWVFDFYFGWRNRGNFGGKINIGTKKKGDGQ